MYSVQPVYTVQRRQNCTKLINQFLVGILSVSDVTSSLYLKNCGDCCVCVHFVNCNFANGRSLVLIPCTPQARVEGTEAAQYQDSRAKGRAKVCRQ